MKIARAIVEQFKNVETRYRPRPRENRPFLLLGRSIFRNDATPHAGDANARFVRRRSLSLRVFRFRESSTGQRLIKGNRAGNVRTVYRDRIRARRSHFRFKSSLFSARSIRSSSAGTTNTFFRCSWRPFYGHVRVQNEHNASRFPRPVNRCSIYSDFGDRRPSFRKALSLHRPVVFNALPPSSLHTPPHSIGYVNNDGNGRARRRTRRTRNCWNSGGAW